MAKLLDCVVVEHNPQNKPIQHAVIWLHGLGASGHDFEPIVPQLDLRDDISVRFIFPHAPQRAVTINGGFVMPAWYDILEMTLDRKVDVKQIEESTQQIRALIEQQNQRGIPTKNIVLAGFSQGGAVAYHTALSHDEKLAGLLALSTYLATNDEINYSTVNQQMPIKVYHGTHDPVVPELLGQKATTQLTKKGYNVSYSTYPMAHQVCMPQIVSIGEWFNEVLIQDML